METVLTIDFDIMLYQDLPLYNSFISGNGTGINDIVNDFPMLKETRFDYFMYKDITNFILTLFKKLDKDKIYFCYNHNYVVNFTEDLKEKFNIINMDFHHDIGYNIKNWDEKIERFELGCGNWIKYLKDNEKINNHIWINANSSVMDEEISKTFLPHKILTMPKNSSEIEEEILKADRLILCASFSWIPKGYQELFYLWADLYNNFYNVDEPVAIY